MLWSHLAQWAADQVYPAPVARHMRMATYIQSREGDLTSWRFAKEMEVIRLERLGGAPAHVEGLRGAIAEIDGVLRWMRNTDWPFR
jgi:hypothetical protein